MKPGTTNFICLMLIACLAILPVQTIQAGMIGTDQVVTAAQAQAARATVLSQIGRAEVAAELQSLGLTPQNARERVAALTDTEVVTLAGQIDSLPAGGSSAVAIVIIVLVIGAIIWWALVKY